MLDKFHITKDSSVPPDTLYLIPKIPDLCAGNEGLKVTERDPKTGGERYRELTRAEKKRFGMIKNIGK